MRFFTPKFYFTVGAALAVLALVGAFAWLS